MTSLHRTRNFAYTLVFLSFVCQCAFAQDSLVALGSNWKYLDDGSDPGSAWRQTGFDDSVWLSGPAELGYGDGDEATVVSFGGNSSNKHITTYFRHQFSVAAAVSGLQLELVRDDGAVVYLNGVEVFRSNLPSGPISASTTAQSAIGGADESTSLTAQIDPTPLLMGLNTLAVEIHQANSSSSDISFDLELLDAQPAAVTRGPYLQNASAGSVTVRWRTGSPRDAVVRFGTDPGNLDQSVADLEVATDHSVRIDGLNPDTRYFYSVGDGGTELAGGAEFYFDTHPLPGIDTPTRIWVLGDSGTANSNAAAVRDAYVAHNNGPHADVWLMLGDNAYNDGTDAQYQAAVFDMYPQSLRNSVLWSTLGNHDGHSADSATQTGPYYDIFSFPIDGHAGGVGSGTEAYYSFDYANIHFVSLDSYDSNRSTGGAMATWLENDLAATAQEWIIAFWHHPPYSKGSHDSDTESRLIDMRANFLPILEAYGVDLVLGGHSHSYERSMLIDGHYGSSGTFSATHVVDSGNGNPAGDGAYDKIASANGGAVYAVAGSSGKISNAPLDHPIMIRNLVELGSLIIDVTGQQLDVVFLNRLGTVADTFRLSHAAPPSTPPASPIGLTASASSASDIALAWTDNAVDEAGFRVERSTDQASWATVANPGPNAQSALDMGLQAETAYYYRAVAWNSAGDSAPSNTASATTDALPDFVDYFALAQSPVTGSVNGDLAAIQNDDGNLQSISEIESGGKPSKRRSLLEHQWQFNLQGGSAVTLFAQVYSGGSSDGDAFDLSYSLNGGASWQSIVVVTSTDSDNLQTGSLPGNASGTVLLRLTDTDRTQGNRALDTVYIDALWLRVATASGTPPAAPDALTASAVTATSVALDWNDNAGDELGYELQRRLASESTWSVLASLAANADSYIDGTVTPANSYRYRVRGFSAAGTSEFSNIAVADTPDGISLSVSGGKIKGVIHNTLSWFNANGQNVDVYRNGAVDATVPNSGNYSDNTGDKGSHSYTYRVCESGSTTQCSNQASVSY